MRQLTDPSPVQFNKSHDLKVHFETFPPAEFRFCLKSKLYFGKRMCVWGQGGRGAWDPRTCEVLAGGYLTLPPVAGTFPTSTSSRCCGMASCSGPFLNLSSSEHLFQTGYVLCSELLGPRRSEVIWLSSLFLVPGCSSPIRPLFRAWKVEGRQGLHDWPAALQACVECRAGCSPSDIVSMLISLQRGPHTCWGSFGNP